VCFTVSVNAAARESERLSVLVVEDNAADADLVREMLLEAGPVAAGAVAPEVHHVETLRGALAVAERPFDVALLDLGLPDASGFEGLRALNTAVPGLPAVVLTGAPDPALGAQALVAGAQDFLVKGQVGGELLLRSLRFAVARQQHLSQLRQLGAAQAARAAAEAEGARFEALAEENARLFRGAQEAVRARDEFISVASHELRTPLGALHLAVGELRRTLGACSDDATARRFAVATRSVERLVRLVNTLLDVSRFRTAGYQLTCEPLDLSRVTQDAIEQLRMAAIAAGCELRLDAPEPVLGSWDRTAVEQILVNLVENAVKYAPGTPVDIGVTSSGGGAVVAVRDHGNGIAPENASRIFDRFERGIPAERSSGLGLGLYIARHLAQVHGGRIELESSPGAGATFRVVLPLSSAAARAIGGSGAGKLDD